MDISLLADPTAAAPDGPGDPLNGSLLNREVKLNFVDTEIGKPETVRLSLTPEQLAMFGLSGNEISIAQGEVQLNTESDMFDQTLVTQGPVISLKEGKYGVSSITLLSESKTDPDSSREITDETSVGKLVSAARDLDTSTKAYIQNAGTVGRNTQTYNKRTVGYEVSIVNALKTTIKAAVDVFICETCGESFHNNGDWERHILIHEGDELRFIGKDNDFTEEDFKSLNCGICGKSFMSERDLEKHKSYTCEKCRKCYTSKNSYLSHKKTHTDEPSESFEIDDNPSTKVDVMGYVRRLMDRNPLDCIYCGKGYSNKLKLKMHRRRHYGETPFQCIFCDQYFSSHHDLVEHMPTHTQNEENPFACLNCDKSFGTRSHLTSHKAQHCEVKEVETESSNESGIALKGKAKLCKIPTEIDRFKCVICAEEFGNKMAALSHAKSHAGEKPFMCSLCGKCFQLKSKLLRHIRRHAGETPYKQTTLHQSNNTLVKSASQIETRNLRYKCEYCEERFALMSALKKHKNTAHAHANPVEKTHKCMYCKRKFATVQLLIVHKQTHTKDKKHQCQYCEKSFSSLSALSVHRRIHTGRRHQCDDCGKRFFTSEKLIEHKQKHTGEKLVFSCKDCKKVFSSRKSLNKHTKRNCNTRKQLPKLIKCPMCEKILKTEGYLKMHMKVHTGEKPYICEQCGEGFSFRVTLMTHAMTHTTGRPFSCNLCDKTFRLENNLKIHMRTHNGEKPYICEICGKGFNLKMHLINHIKRHTEPKSFKCEYCDKVLENETELNGHVCD